MAATRVIEIRTEIPGPRSREILERERHAVARPLIVHEPIVADRARGSTITDVDGNTFVDFVGGVGVANVGHNHPRVLDAIAEQAERFLHTDFTVVPYEGYVELAERLGALVADQRGDARRVLQRRRRGGRERGEARAPVHEAPGRDRVRGRVPRAHVDGADDDVARRIRTRRASGPSRPRSTERRTRTRTAAPMPRRALAALERMFTTHVSPEHVAAIVFEPQQGEGGFLPAPAEFVDGLRRICDEHGIVLVADEVQTGFGRTGRMFAMEHFDVEPDLMIVAKSIAGGLPLSGVIGRAAIMDDPHAGAIGGTFIGNPVALAAALAVLDVFAEEELVARAELLGDAIRARMLDVAVALAADRRRPRARRDARDRARSRSRDEGAGARARRGGDRRGAAAGLAAPEGRSRRQLHPRALPADDVGRRARRRASAPGKRRSPRCSASARSAASGRLPACSAGEERKLVTVLFADLVGSTAYAGDRDPERVRAQLERFYDAMREEIELTGGTVEKFAGDAVMAVFGAPAALEDHAERALHAALAMQQRMRELFGGELEMRVGVNTGEVVVGAAREGGSFVTGDAVNVADRSRRPREPGEVLAGERTAAAAAGAFEFGVAADRRGEGQAGGVDGVPVDRALRTMRPRGVGRPPAGLRRSRRRARSAARDLSARCGRCRAAPRHARR